MSQSTEQGASKPGQQQMQQASNVQGQLPEQQASTMQGHPPAGQAGNMQSQQQAGQAGNMQGHQAAGQAGNMQRQQPAQGGGGTHGQDPAQQAGSVPRQWATFPSLKDKRVLITGGATGIGAELVAAFVRQHSRVAFVDIARAEGDALCARFDTNAPMFRHGDLTDLADLDACLQAITAELGDIDILINNAANDQRHALEQLKPEQWDRLTAINQRPMFFTCQAVVPAMRRRGGGAIINLGSISWHIKSAGYPAYAAAKAAALGLTRGLARDLGRDNIRINTVAPGWVMTERQLALWVDAAAEQDIHRNQCLPGKLMPADVAAMVLFLAADDGAMCTGQEFIVDAGWS